MILQVANAHGLAIPQYCYHDGLSIVLSTHDLNGMAAHLPTLVCMNGTVTGHGLKDPDVAKDAIRGITTARAEKSEILKLIEG